MSIIPGNEWLPTVVISHCLALGDEATMNYDESLSLLVVTVAALQGQLDVGEQSTSFASFDDVSPMLLSNHNRPYCLMNHAPVISVSRHNFDDVLRR